MTDAKRLRWFAEAQYGLFFHWGLYSLTGRNEWTLNADSWTFAEYEQLADRFTAEHFDPAQWTRIAVDAGARYMVLTSRHHEGFCLFDSQTTDFTAARRGARRDLIAQYVEAVRAAGLKVGLYYSLVDWRFKGAWNHYRHPDSARAMVDQAHAQVRELLPLGPPTPGPSSPISGAAMATPTTAGSLSAPTASTRPKSGSRTPARAAGSTPTCSYSAASGGESRVRTGSPWTSR